MVETKISNDPMLMLQDLDYWIWATANATQLQANFGLGKPPRVVVDFVAAAPASGDVIEPYKAGALAVFGHLQQFVVRATSEDR